MKQTTKVQQAPKFLKHQILKTNYNQIDINIKKEMVQIFLKDLDMVYNKETDMFTTLYKRNLISVRFCISHRGYRMAIWQNDRSVSLNYFKKIMKITEED